MLLDAYQGFHSLVSIRLALYEGVDAPGHLLGVYPCARHVQLASANLDGRRFRHSCTAYMRASCDINLCTCFQGMTWLEWALLSVTLRKCRQHADARRSAAAHTGTECAAPGPPSVMVEPSKGFWKCCALSLDVGRIQTIDVPRTFTMSRSFVLVFALVVGNAALEQASYTLAFVDSVPGSWEFAELAMSTCTTQSLTWLSDTHGLSPCAQQMRLWQRTSRLEQQHGS